MDRLERGERSRSDTALLTPLEWNRTLSGAPVSSGSLTASTPILVRRWTGVSSIIEQPPLDHHYVTLHLGGPKRIRRKGDGREAHNEIADGAYSISPAGSAFDWRTEGPVDFAHVYFRPSTIDDVIGREFDRDARTVALQDTLGARDPLAEALLAIAAGSLTSNRQPSRLYWDGLTHTLICQLLHLHSTVASTGASSPHILAPGRVTRVIDFIESHLGDDIGLSELAKVAGVSSFHFCRGFKRATGSAPYAFMIRRRLEHARELLRETEQPLGEIALACGFASHSRFSTMFKRATGISPSHYRMRQ